MRFLALVYNKPMNIQEMTVEQLKAMAYDTLVKAMAYDTLVSIEVGQNNLKVINQEIAKRSTPHQELQNAPGEEMDSEEDDSTV